jgi:hypothetical protein
MIDFALPLFELGQKVDFARLITMLEFNTLALDTLVQRAAPEEADRLLDLAIEHAEIPWRVTTSASTGAP